MPFVLDSSVALAWLLPGEAGGAVDLLADRLEAEPAIVPTIWRLEVANALLMARRRDRLTEKDVDRLLGAINELPIERDAAIDDVVLTSIVTLARKLGLTSYDAAYLELARRRAVPLATLDARLREACAAAGVEALP